MTEMTLKASDWIDVNRDVFESDWRMDVSFLRIPLMKVFRRCYSRED